MPYIQFRDLCSSWWKKYGFLVIDKGTALDCGRYRKEFDQFLINIAASKKNMVV